MRGCVFRLLSRLGDGFPPLKTSLYLALVVVVHYDGVFARQVQQVGGLFAAVGIAVVKHYVHVGHFFGEGERVAAILVGYQCAARPVPERLDAVVEPGVQVKPVPVVGGDGE